MASSDEVIEKGEIEATKVNSISLRDLLLLPFIHRKMRKTRRRMERKRKIVTTARVIRRLSLFRYP